MTRPPSLPSRLVRAVLLWLYGRFGLALEGRAPVSKRCVIVGAPHTTNWDFVVFLGVTQAFGLAPRFIGKASLFRWPMTRFMREMGGVPVDRTTRSAQAQAMVAAFAGQESFALVVAPEGSRSASAKWRSGFWHIARGAGVPVVPAWFDRAGKRAGMGPEMMMTDDYAADMARLAAFYASVLPGHPRLALITA